MPLTQKHRSSIYQSLTPILGEEETEALLSHLPTEQGDELVTRGMLLATESTLRAELAELRADLHSELRRQTQWVFSAIIGSVTLSSVISAGIAAAT